jgi:hypothetical protein
MSSYHIEPEQLPEIAPHNEGKTPAAWVTNGGIVLGFAISGAGLMIPNSVLVWTGLGVAVAALVAGAILRALGYGQPLK